MTPRSAAEVRTHPFLNGRETNTRSAQQFPETPPASPRPSPDLRRQKKLYNERWVSKNRDKYLAHKLVEGAIKSGRLAALPCERCGATDLVHAHHDDYSRPLEVRWLCPTHHKERHRELDASGGPVRAEQSHPKRRYKLTPAQVLDIASSPLNSSALAKLYCCSRENIRLIRKGEIWSEVTGIGAASPEIAGPGQ